MAHVQYAAYVYLAKPSPARLRALEQAQKALLDIDLPVLEAVGAPIDNHALDLMYTYLALEQNVIISERLLEIRERPKLRDFTTAAVRKPTKILYLNAFRYKTLEQIAAQMVGIEAGHDKYDQCDNGKGFFTTCTRLIPPVSDDFASKRCPNYCVTARGYGHEHAKNRSVIEVEE